MHGFCLIWKRIFFLFCVTFGSYVYSMENEDNLQISPSELTNIFNLYCNAPSDINEHLPDLCLLAAECGSVIEIGVRSVVSTWALLKGLSESQQPGLTYLGIDLEDPPIHLWNKAESLARKSNIVCQFWQANDMTIDIPVIDMLFIDSMHTYCHLTYELEKFSPQVRKYIAMHDTSDPWGSLDDGQYTGDYSEYDPSIDRSKRGLWPAVVDFLNKHPEWKLHQRKLNNHGFTVLKRT